MNRPFRACSCRGPTTTGPDGRKRPGRLLGKSCPKLKTDSRHGGWYGRYEAPPGPDGRRRQPRIGPFSTEREAARALTKAVGEVDAGTHAADRKLPVAAYLGRWLDDVKPNLKARTWSSYEEAVRLYFGPGIGHIRLADLRDHHIRVLYAAMRKINRPEAGTGNDELLRRLLAARREIPHLPGVRWGTRPVGEAGVKRRHVVLVAALNNAVERKLIAFNPASAIRFRLRKQRPLLWTEPRVQWWRETGRKPAVVMVWSPAQAGRFLDSTEGDRLYALYHLAAYWGPRREELAGLEWADVDLKTRRLHIRQAQAAGELDSTKSEDSDRVIAIDAGTAAVLKEWRDRQSFEAWSGVRAGRTAGACSPGRTARRCALRSLASTSRSCADGRACRRYGSTTSATAARACYQFRRGGWILRSCPRSWAIPRRRSRPTCT